MPHLRERHAWNLLQSLSTHSPLVGVLGHRQVGKTTLLESFCSSYFSMDDEDIAEKIIKSPKDFLQTQMKAKTGLDEVQLYPKLFPALKERVRIDKRPGQFILSGSVRFTSRKAIRESLTGRILYLEVLPMVLSELTKTRLLTICRDVLKSKDLNHLNTHSFLEKSFFEKRAHAFEKYLDHGGLPGTCFIRNSRDREQKIKDQLETILGRDLHLVLPTTLSYQSLLEYVRLLSKHQGEILHLTQLRRESGISESTQKKILYALEAVFVIRSMPVEGGRKGTVIFLEDQAEALLLSLGQISPHDQFIHAVYRNARAHFFYEIGSNVRFFQYRTRGKALIPFAAQTPDGYLGFLPIREDEPSRSESLQAKSFIQTYGPNTKILMIHRSRTTRCVDAQTLLIPAQCLG